MQAKSERMELRLDQATIDRIDGWRGGETDLPSRSEAVRRLVEAGLTRRASSEAPITTGEKLILAMLSDLLKGSKTKGEIDPDFVMSAIYGGHYWALDWQLTGLLHDHVDREADLREVVDTLDMWSFIEEAAEEMSPDAVKGLPRQPVFVGYDGNNEPSHRGIARFMVEKMERFTRFAGRSLNSHHPVVTRYRQMVAVFEPIRARLVGRKLTLAELSEILGAEH